MLKGIPKILSPELLKVMCEMGHGDRLVIADGNFPASEISKDTVIIRMDGHGVCEVMEAMLQLFGTGVRSVTAKRTGKTLTAIAAYDLFPVFMNYSIRHDQLYAGYYGANGNALVPFSWSKAGDVQFEELVQFAKTKEMKYRPEYFLEVVKISCALEQSMKEERTVYLF